MLADRERDDELGFFILKELDRFLVEMVVMVVRNDDRVNRREFLPFQGGRLETLDHPAEGRCALAEHRIHEQDLPVDVQKKSRMSKPDKLHLLAWKEESRDIGLDLGQQSLRRAGCRSEKELVSHG